MYRDKQDPARKEEINLNSNNWILFKVLRIPKLLHLFLLGFLIIFYFLWFMRRILCVSVKALAN